MKKYFNKKSIILIIITLFILITIVLNFTNIKKITGNVLLNESYETTITEELINNMQAGDIISEIQSDSNMQENKLSYVNFDSNENAKMSILKSTKREGIYSLKSIFKFSNNNSKKQIRVSLNKAVRYEYDGFSEIQKDLLNGSKEDIITENVTNELLGVAYNFNDGIKIYNLKNNIELTTLILNVSPNSVLDYSSVNDAIKIELIEDDVVVNTKMLGVDFDFSYIPMTFSGTNKTQNGGEIDSFVRDDRLVGFYSVKGTSRKILFEEFVYTIRVPKGVKYKGLLDKTTGSLIEYKYSNSDYICEKYNSNNEKFSCEEDIIDNREFDIYKFVSKTPFINKIGGINPIWFFEKEKFNNGEIVEITVEQIEFKKYGSEKITLSGNQCSGNICSSKFKITNDADMMFNNDIISLYAHNDFNKEALIGLSYLDFYNASPFESIRDKEIVYNIPKELSVKEIIIPIISEMETKICYKSDKKTSWSCKENFKIYDEYDSDLSAMKITLEKLGDNDSNEITALMYNVGKIPGYYSMSDYDYALLGHVKEVNTQMDDEITKKVPTDFYVTYSVNDLGYQESFDNDSPNNSLDNVKYVMRSANVNKIQYLGIYPINSVGDNSGIVKSGSVVEFRSMIYLYSSNNFTHRNIYRPIIYVRNPYKQPIKNIKLLLSTNSTNKNAIDVGDKFDISYTLDKDGYYIYKLEIKENESVHIGYKKYRADAGALQWLYLSYEVDIPKSFYKAENVKLNDSIFVDSYDSRHAFPTGDNVKSGDPYDVDFDGITNEDKMNSNVIDKYYRVISPIDLNVDIKQKSSSETNYVYKENTNISVKELLNLNVSINNPTGINIRNSAIYIPIPKKNNKFIDKTFNIDMQLNEFLTEEDNIKISYAKNASILSYEELSKIDFMDKEKINKEEVSIIKIEVININPEETKNIYYDLKLNNNKIENIEENFDFVYYRKFSYESTVRSGYEKGNEVFITSIFPKYNLKVIHKTIYDEILETENKEYTYNDAYITEKLDKEGVEVYKTEGNVKGIIKEDTFVTYIYRPTKLIDVKIEHISKDTNEKISEDIILKGKVLDKYSYKPKSIDGYKLLDNKTIEGIYDKENEVYIVYYEKNKTIIETIINNPSTFDSVILYIILFVLSITSILLCIYYFKKFSLIYNNKK